MLVSSLDPKVTHKAEFSDAGQNSIPEKSGCYVLTSGEDIILYIGQSENIHRRISQHLNAGDKKITSGGVVTRWVYYLFWLDTDLDRLERHWINQHKATDGRLPPFNEV